MVSAFLLTSAGIVPFLGLPSSGDGTGARITLLAPLMTRSVWRCRWTSSSDMAVEEEEEESEEDAEAATMDSATRDSFTIRG